MAKFKKGDKVRRLVEDYGPATVGEVYTVAGYRSRYSLALEGHVYSDDIPWGYKEDYFELVQEPPAPKEFRFRRTADARALSSKFDTAESAAEYLRANGATGREYEIVEVSVVQTVTVRRTLEVKQ
ncbi:hypothetical protein LMG3458_02474 [Achromobacter deleyi]|uniref:Uncharacterized protein n=1 Tax=Achromobacter deleyi TaxID=1353891 RepID=A0A6S6ZUH3_9BURK|nr:hypothetical protein [Achromobacter deleyi]CAB3697631.1 hypothetical protein LMG3458_02474 [Achromobacter deleyi]